MGNLWLFTQHKHQNKHMLSTKVTPTAAQQVQFHSQDEHTRAGAFARACKEPRRTDTCAHA